VASILKAERTALNFLQHLSGIATETARYVDAVSGTKAIITDTRKTIPGLRLLEKYAVRAGGGRNHRLNLGDGVLIKDNHLAALRSSGVGLGEAVKQARERAPRTMKIEVEVESVKQAQEALSAGADIIMLDNMNVKDMRRVVKLVQGRALLEASGGITLDNVRSVAEAGVDLISVGALTHSAKALDISLEVELQ
jgi:nicotinate-nucleotide pyrophosphorylase (carboxylating)